MLDQDFLITALSDAHSLRILSKRHPKRRILKHAAAVNSRQIPDDHPRYETHHTISFLALQTWANHTVLVTLICPMSYAIISR